MACNCNKNSKSTATGTSNTTKNTSNYVGLYVPDATCCDDGDGPIYIKPNEIDECCVTNVIQVGKLSDWNTVANTTVPLDKQIIVYTDGNENFIGFKIGNGTSTLKNLPWATMGSDCDCEALQKAIGANGAKITTLQTLTDTINDEVNTLVSADPDKSVRTIANEALAKALIPADAKASMDTLEEIAAWIQSHPDDASAMNKAIEALQTQVNGAIKSVSVDGTTFTVTMMDGTTKTFETQDTTYSEATTTEAGLMSASDKEKLDGLNEVDIIAPLIVGENNDGIKNSPPKANTPESIAIGINSEAGTTSLLPDGDEYYQNGIAIGGSAQALGENAIGMGRLAYALGSSSIVFGFEAVAKEDGAIAIGDSVNKDGTGSRSVAIGYHAGASGESSVAIGNSAFCGCSDSVAIGSSSICNGNEIVSVGNDGLYRRITHVSDPTDATDAATKNYVDTNFEQKCLEAYVGSNDALDPNYKWFKFAHVSFDEVYHNCNLVLIVKSTYSSNSAGIASVSIRYDGSGVSVYRLEWLTGSAVQPNIVVDCDDNEATFYIESDFRYQHFHIKVIEESDTTTVKPGYTLTMYNSTEPESGSITGTNISNGIVDLIYPVGSIYMSVNSTSPATLFGGTWTQLQDRFLIGAGSSYAVNATGGSTTHTLTTAEMPSHTHTFTGSAVTSGTQSANHTHTFSATSGSSGAHGHTAKFISITQNKGAAGTTYENFTITNNWNTIKNEGDYDGYGYGTLTIPSAGAHTHSVSGTTGANSANHTHSVTAKGTNSSTGSGNAHSIMNPYLAVYMWKRTA